MKKIVLTVFICLFSVQYAHADVFYKAEGVDGMGEMSTWISGKKKREEAVVTFPTIGAQKTVKIMRADRNLEWDIDDELKVYEERPIFASAAETADNLSPMPEHKMPDVPREEEMCNPVMTVLPQKQTIAGFQATGYQAKCSEEMPVTTLWIAPATGALVAFDKETKIFDKAYRDLMYKDLSPADRKMVETVMGAMGNAMGQALLGVRADKLPKNGVGLKMEQTISEPGSPSQTSVLMNMTEVREEKTDASLFEIPVGYKKVPSVMQLKSEKMMQQMGFGAMPAQMPAAEDAEVSAPDETAPAETQDVAPAQTAQPSQTDPNNVVYED